MYINYFYPNVFLEYKVVAIQPTFLLSGFHHKMGTYQVITRGKKTKGIEKINDTPAPTIKHQAPTQAGPLPSCWLHASPNFAGIFKYNQLLC